MRRLLLPSLLGLLVAGCGNGARDPRPMSGVKRQLTIHEIEDRGLNVPCPPEAIAGIIDRHISSADKAICARLVEIDTKEPQEYAWVIWGSSRPVMVTTAPKATPENTSGMTARALQRARTYMAEQFDMRGEARPKDWTPPPLHLTSEYQLKSYGRHIVSIECLDAKTESWRITAVPARSMTAGGEIWMRFDKDTKVSAEFGK